MAKQAARNQNQNDRSLMVRTGFVVVANFSSRRRARLERFSTGWVGPEVSTLICWSLVMKCAATAATVPIIKETSAIGSFRPPEIIPRSKPDKVAKFTKVKLAESHFIAAERINPCRDRRNRVSGPERSP